MLHQRELIGKKAVYNKMSLCKTGYYIPELRPADIMPVSKGLSGAVVPELHIPHHPAEHTNICPSDKPGISVFDLGESFYVELKLLLLIYSSGHFIEHPVKGIDKDNFIFT
ncbi:hypothetical protein ES703_86457 [subsurface metagenome]